MSLYLQLILLLLVCTTQGRNKWSQLKAFIEDNVDPDILPKAVESLRHSEPSDAADDASPVGDLLGYLLQAKEYVRGLWVVLLGLAVVACMLSALCLALLTTLERRTRKLEQVIAELLKPSEKQAM